MIFKDYYKILGMETKDATLEEIKLAYREQAKKYHPDVNIGVKNSEERFKDINEAYRVLSEPSSRRKYDRMWNNYVGKKKVKYEESNIDKTSIFSDFFNIFFGNPENKKVGAKTSVGKKDRTPVKGENIDTEVEVSIEEAFNGANKKISLRTISGKMKTFDVKIPAGIQNNEKIRLIGQGKSGENGGKNGDLFIKIKIKDSSCYKLIGYDLYSNLLVTPWEAVLGTKASIDCIDEEAIIIVPKGTQSGELLRIPGKGYKDGKGGRGDLVAEVKIVIPKNMNEKEIELYKELSKISKFSPRM